MATATKKNNLEQVFAMWKQKAKSGKDYFNGTYEGKLIKGFYNLDKKNLKEPDLKIYTVEDNNELSKEPILVLWHNATENGKEYLSGKLDDKRVVGFINKKANDDNKQPYVSIYWSEEAKKPEAKKETKKKTQKAKVEEVEDNGLPF